MNTTRLGAALGLLSIAGVALYFGGRSSYPSPPVVPEPLGVGVVDAGTVVADEVVVRVSLRAAQAYVEGDLSVDGGVSVRGDYLTEDGLIYTVNGDVGTDNGVVFADEVFCGSGTANCVNGNGGITMQTTVNGKQGIIAGIPAVLPSGELTAPVGPPPTFVQEVRLSVGGAGIATDVPIVLDTRGAGEVYVENAPFVLTSGQRFYLNEARTAYLQWTGANFFVVPGAGSFVESGPMLVQNTFTAQQTVTAGTSSTMAARLSGGASGASLTVVNGAGSAVDGGLTVSGGAPNGLVTYPNQSGVKLVQFGAADGGIVGMNGKGLNLPLEALPTACNSTTGPYMSQLIAEVRADGGFEYVPAWCDTQDYRVMVPLLTYSATSASPGGGGYTAGDEWLRTNPGIAGGELWYCTYHVPVSGIGVGAGTYTIQIKQGATVLCTSPAISCTASGDVWDGDPRVGTGSGPCSPNYVLPRPAGSGPANYLVSAAFTAGCNTFPVGSLSCYSRRNTLQRTVP